MLYKLLRLRVQADAVAPAEAGGGEALASRPGSAAAASGDAELQADPPGGAGAGEAPERAGGEAGPAGTGDAEPPADPGATAHPFGFPLTLIKRVMCLDPDVSRVSADGLKAVAKAAELVLELLTEKAAAQARCARLSPWRWHAGAAYALMLERLGSDSPPLRFAHSAAAWHTACLPHFRG